MKHSDMSVADKPPISLTPSMWHIDAVGAGGVYIIREATGLKATVRLSCVRDKNCCLAVLMCTKYAHSIGVSFRARA